MDEKYSLFKNKFTSSHFVPNVNQSGEFYIIRIHIKLTSCNGNFCKNMHCIHKIRCELGELGELGVVKHLMFIKECCKKSIFTFILIYHNYNIFLALSFGKQKS